MKKTIFITGSVKGLGREIAKYFAVKNYSIVIHYNKSKSTAETFFNELNKVNKDIFLVQGDVTKEDDVRRIFIQIKEKFEKIDFLVNNVGNFMYKKFEETNLDDFKNVIETNIYSVFLCSKEAVKIMDKSGCIINIGCVSCDKIVVGKHTTPYYIAKSGVYALTKLMARELPIRVNMISPSVLNNSAVMPETKSYCDPEDVINAIEFLLSEKSKKITGANIEVSGGWNPQLY